MVLEAPSIRQQTARTKRGFLGLGALGLLVLTCILALGHRAGRQHDLVSGAAAARAARTDNAGQQSTFLPRALALTRSTLRDAFASSSTGSLSQQSQRSDVFETTLVLYCHSHEDQIRKSNFRYFLRWGLAEVPGVEYLFVVSNKTQKDVLPSLPENARYWEASVPECTYGLGLIGEALRNGQVARAKHKFYVLTGSHSRGPFLPPFLQGQRHWTQYFLGRLKSPVKLVGPTISCQEPENGLNTTDGYGMVPYVQFLAFATDASGLALMEQEKTVFSCYNNSKSAGFWGERGAARAVLKAGHNIDSYMLRYVDVDWRNQSNWGCNARLDPLMEWRYDGISVNPFEIMFVPMDLTVVENGYTYAKQAAVYDSWLSLQDADRADIATNVWERDAMAIKRQRMAYIQSRGPGCFDTKYYLSKNPDLIVIPTPLQLWDHFVSNGQFEGRSFRWSCDDDRRLPWE